MGFWHRLFGKTGHGQTAPPEETASPEPASHETAAVVADASLWRLESHGAVPVAKARKVVWSELLSQTIERDGVLVHAVPIVPVWIQGLPCMANHAVTFRPNGRIHSLRLAREFAFDGEMLPEGVLVMMSETGSLASFMRVLPGPRTWQVPTAPGSSREQPMTVPANSEVIVEGSRLRRVTLAGAIDFDGMTFPADTVLTFGDSGALSHVQAPAELQLRDILWAFGETLVFAFGKLREGYPVADGMLNGVPYRGGEILRFHDNGALARCILSKKAVLDGVPCAEDTGIYLDENGHLLEGVLARDCTIASVPVAQGGVVLLDNGMPIALIPREDVVIDKIPCAHGKLIELSETGRLVSGTLSQEHVFGAWTLPCGSVFVCNDGRLERFIATDSPGLPGTWRVEVATGQRWPTVGDRFGEVIHLREATTVDDLVAHANTALELNSDGSVRSLVLARDQRVGALFAKGQTRVTFHSNRTPSSLFLVEDTVIKDVPCAAARTIGTVINGIETNYRECLRLNEDGTVNFADLARDAVVDGVPLAGGNTIGCHPGGGLHFGTLSARWSHPDGWVAERGTTLHLFANRTPSLITLAEPYNGQAAGTLLCYDQPGIVASATPANVPLGTVEPISETR